MPDMFYTSFLTLSSDKVFTIWSSRSSINPHETHQLHRKHPYFFMIYTCQPCCYTYSYYCSLRIFSRYSNPSIKSSSCVFQCSGSILIAPFLRRNSPAESTLSSHFCPWARNRRKVRLNKYQQCEATSHAVTKALCKPATISPTSPVPVTGRIRFDMDYNAKKC